MRIGDLVHNPNNDCYLRCGCGRYNRAVVLSITPLILVSEETDMRWDLCDKKYLKVIGRTSFFNLIRCFRRLNLKEIWASLKQIF